MKAPRQASAVVTSLVKGMRAPWIRSPLLTRTRKPSRSTESIVASSALASAWVRARVRSASAWSRFMCATISSAASASGSGRAAAYEVDVRHLESPEAEVLEVDPVGGPRLALEVPLTRGRALRRGHAESTAHERHSASGQRIIGPAGLRDEQARPRIGLEVLRVHGHRADEEERRAVIVGGIRHDRTERMPRVPARERRERARASEMDKGAGPLRVARLGRRWRRAFLWCGSRVTAHVRLPVVSLLT